MTAAMSRKSWRARGISAASRQRCREAPAPGSRRIAEQESVLTPPADGDRSASTVMQPMRAVSSALRPRNCSAVNAASCGVQYSAEVAETRSAGNTIRDDSSKSGGNGRRDASNRGEGIAISDAPSSGHTNTAETSAATLKETYRTVAGFKLRRQREHQRQRSIPLPGRPKT